MANKGILCVDDEVTILDSLKEQLKRHFGSRFFYEVATSADEALEVLEELTEEALDVLVIVADCLMPGMKGDELLVAVHQKYPQIVTVMLTGQADESAIQRAKTEANLYRCLHKPWAENELVEAITSGLGS
ncbi:MAG: response regulator [Cyanobacteria bacterium P01_F01_bin.86]